MLLQMIDRTVQSNNGHEQTTCTLRTRSLESYPQVQESLNYSHTTYRALTDYSTTTCRNFLARHTTADLVNFLEKVTLTQLWMSWHDSPQVASNEHTCITELFDLIQNSHIVTKPAASSIRTPKAIVLDAQDVMLSWP